MASWRGRVVQVSVLGLLVLGFLAAGLYVLVQQHTGEEVTAGVTSCDVRRRSETCHGTWEVDGRTEAGIVDGATADDVGHTVVARAHGDRAYVPNWRVPAVLIGVGLLWPVAAVVAWLRRLATRGARGPGGRLPDPPGPRQVR